MYKNGKKCGLGLFKWADGSTYESEFKDNEIEGYGIYGWNNGHTYAGDWKNTRWHGKGLLPGVMADRMRESTSTAKNRAGEFLHGQMRKSGKDFGITEIAMG